MFCVYFPLLYYDLGESKCEQREQTSLFTFNLFTKMRARACKYCLQALNIISENKA
jgi:hypothetical protein